MKLNGKLSRRQFLEGAGLALAAPYVLTSRALGAADKDAASERIGVGVIGFHNIGKSHLNAALGMRQFELRGCCDVDKKILAMALARAEKRGRKNVPHWADFRHMLDAKDIDAVVIAAPDHWHALMTVYACRAGKDVYCEKPLSLTIREGRLMVEAVRKYKRVFQTGSQHRSKNHTRLACELVRSGRIGKVHTIRTGLAGVNWPPPPVPDSDPPPELDYDMWLGPAPKRPYNKKRVHYNFRFFWDYSGGQMTNFGHHCNDLAQWGNGTELTGPVAAEGTAEYGPPGWYEVPKTSNATLTYASGVRLISKTGGPGGAEFEGTKGKILCGYSKIKSDPPELAKEPLGPNDVRLYKSTNHRANWAECIKTRKKPICDVEIGHRSVTVCHLANIAILLKRKIRWDPDKEEIVGDEEATRMLHKPYRPPWTL
jgi:predicted dehydrogenase